MKQIHIIRRAPVRLATPGRTPTPPHLLGRYMSVLSLTVTGGFAIGPAIGGAVLAYSPDAVWWGGALVTGAIGAGFSPRQRSHPGQAANRDRQVIRRMSVVPTPVTTAQSASSLVTGRAREGCTRIGSPGILG